MLVMPLGGCDHRTDGSWKNHQIFSLILKRLFLPWPWFSMSVTLSRPNTCSCRASLLRRVSCLHLTQEYLTVISPASSGHISRKRHFLQSVFPQQSQMTTAIYLPQSSHNVSGIFGILMSFFMGVYVQSRAIMRMACHKHAGVYLFVFNEYNVYTSLPDGMNTIRKGIIRSRQDINRMPKPVRIDPPGIVPDAGPHRSRCCSCPEPGVMPMT